MYKNSVGFFDRLVSCVSYLTAGWGGLIYCVVLYFRKKSPSHFVRFNVFQSIFISLLYFVLAMAIGLLFEYLSYIPFINIVVAQISYIFNRPLVADYSIVQLVVAGFVFYMSIFSLFGKEPRIYWVSKIIDRACA